MSAGERVAVGVGGASAIGVPDPDDLLRVVRTALAEDLRYGPDATTAATVDRGAVAVAAFVLRAGGVLAGVPAVHAVLDEVLGLDEVPGSDEVVGTLDVLAAQPDGSRLGPGEPALVVL